MGPYTRAVRTEDVLRLASDTQHSAYDCEYVALAEELDVPLITGDEALAKSFPDTATIMEAFAKSPNRITGHRSPLIVWGSP